MSPADFVPLAEQTGLIRPLTRWVLDRATGESCAWARAGRRLPVAINVSARSLQDERIVDDVEEALLTHDVRGDRLQIEVTESAVMRDAGRAAEVLASLTGRGVAVSIDDFGTGYSSLGLLRRLPVNELKIDKSFVIGMAGDGAEDTAIVRSTADLAHNLGLTVVAEGVEDQWTLDLLVELRLRPGPGLSHRPPDALGGVRRLARLVALARARELDAAYSRPRPGGRWVTQ